jgi:hypothetical protein
MALGWTIRRSRLAPCSAACRNTSNQVAQGDHHRSSRVSEVSRTPTAGGPLSRQLNVTVLVFAMQEADEPVLPLRGMKVRGYYFAEGASRQCRLDTCTGFMSEDCSTC